jgi:hypothetical protein
VSRQYYGKNKKAKGNFSENYFDVNVAGARMLGIISFEAGFYSESIFKEMGGEKCTPFEATKERCKEAAAKLKALTPEVRKKLADDCKGLYDAALTFEDFCGFIDEWALFLETCNGYEAM